MLAETTGGSADGDTAGPSGVDRAGARPFDRPVATDRADGGVVDDPRPSTEPDP